MAQIKIDYDLSGGDAFSSVVASPGNINLGWKSTVVTNSNQIVALEWWVQAGSEDYHQLKDGNGRAIISKLRGNESGNTNVLGINATNLKIKIVPPASADGTLNLWTA